MTEQLRILQ
jgi:hypothetical protein